MIKKKIKELNLSATLKINEISKNLEKDGKEIIKFGFGQSPFQVPDKIVESLKQNAHQKSYLPIQGLDELREAIAIYESKKKNKNFKADQIFVGPGTKELMFLLHISFAGEIIIPCPSWVSYQPQSVIADNKFHWIKTTPENNWYPTAESIENFILKNKEKKYLMILNSPNNPSGQVCINLKEISEIIKKYKIIVLSDEIYSELSFKDNYQSISNFCPEKTIVSTGLSKWCGAGGWRLGYFLVPNSLVKIKDMINVLASETFSAVSAPIQYAAIKAYNNDHSHYINKSRNILSAVANYVYRNLKSNKVLINEPQGGFYLMPEFINKKFNTSSDMCESILNDTGVALLPGSDFGFDQSKMLARLSFTDFDGQKFMTAIKDNKKIDNDTINEFAPKIIEGVDKLKKWSESI